MTHGKIGGYSKYRNRKVVVDGIEFASKMEADYYCELRMKEMAGEVADIACQVPFVLQNGFSLPDGKKVRKITYIADFVVTYTDGHKEVVDVKGYKTEVYKLKKKLLLNQIKDTPNMLFVEVRNV